MRLSSSQKQYFIQFFRISCYFMLFHLNFVLNGKGHHLFIFICFFYFITPEISNFLLISQFRFYYFRNFIFILSFLYIKVTILKENMDEIKKRLQNTKMKTRILARQNLFVSIPNTPASLQIKSTICVSEVSRLTPRVSVNSLGSKFTFSKEQLRNFRKIENGHHVITSYKRFQYIDRVFFVLILLNFAALAVYTELQLLNVRPILYPENIDILDDETQIEENKKNINFLLWINFGLALLLTPLSFLRYSLQNDFQKLQKKQTDSIYQFLEILIILIQPYPFLQDQIIELNLQKSYMYDPIFMKLNLILVILSTFKAFLIIRHIYWQNYIRNFNVNSGKFFRPSYNRISKLYGTDNNYIHIMKCVFRQNSLAVIAGFYLMSMIPSAYGLRIAESHFDGRFMSIENCIWLTMLSMTTVGYGDITASTPIGIAFDTILMLSGVMITSMLVSALNRLLSLKYRQRRALTLQKRLIKKTEQKMIAAQFLCKYLTRRWRQKKNGVKLPASLEQRVAERQFHSMRQLLKSRKQVQLNLYRDMMNQFQSLRLSMKQVEDAYGKNILTMSQKVRISMYGQRRQGKVLRVSEVLKLTQKNAEGGKSLAEELKDLLDNEKSANPSESSRSSRSSLSEIALNQSQVRVSTCQKGNSLLLSNEPITGLNNDPTNDSVNGLINNPINDLTNGLINGLTNDSINNPTNDLTNGFNAGSIRESTIIPNTGHNIRTKGGSRVEQRRSSHMQINELQKPVEKQSHFAAV